MCYLKAIEGQVSSSALLGTLRVCIDCSFFGYFDGLEKSTFKIGLLFKPGFFGFL